MLKTLRITSIAITIAAIGIIIFAVAGSASNAKTDKLLSLPGVAEQLQASYAGKTTSESDTDTPLMRQAKAFALRINPPPPPAPPVPVQRPNESPRPRVAVSAQFTLIGTSYYADNDANSLALINEVGKGLHWVQLGGTVGHLKIERIGSGVVLIRDGERTYEMVAERTQKANLVQAYTGTIPSVSVPDIWKGLEKSPITTENAQIPVPQVPEQQNKEPNKAEIQANIEWIRQIKDNPKALGMTAEEAKELEGLGDMLKELEAQKQRIDSNTAGSSEPNAANKPIKKVSPATDVNASQQPPTMQKPRDANNNDLLSKRAEMLRARRKR
ncbi:MAG: hypothetical protein WC770_04295 [Phycisphaerae bacterium]|jgi:hypothetical protein